MGTVNRYSKTREGLVVAPLSVEDYTRSGVMEAKAEGNLSKYTSELDFTYDVLEQDAEYIKPKIDELKQGVDGITNDLMSGTITADSYDQALAIKRSKNNYFGKNGIVTKAEENAMGVRIWENQLNEMAVNGKWTAERLAVIKAQGHENFKNGTFNPDGTYNTFKPEYGPGYFDPIQNAKESYALVANSMTEEQNRQYADGELVIKSDPSDNHTLFLYNSRTGKKADNADAVNGVLKQLSLDIVNPKHLAGENAQYFKWNTDNLIEQFTQLSKGFIRSTVTPSQLSITPFENRQLAAEEADLVRKRAELSKIGRTVVEVNPSGDMVTVSPNTNEKNKTEFYKKHAASVAFVEYADDSFSGVWDNLINNSRFDPTAGGMRSKQESQEQTQKVREDQVSAQQSADQLFADQELMDYLSIKGVVIPPDIRNQETGEMNVGNYKEFIEGVVFPLIEDNHEATYNLNSTFEYPEKTGATKEANTRLVRINRRMTLDLEHQKVWSFKDATRLASGTDFKNSPLGKFTTEFGTLSENVQYLGNVNYDFRFAYVADTDSNTGFDRSKSNGHIVSINTTNGVEKYVIGLTQQEMEADKYFYAKSTWSEGLSQIDESYGKSLVLRDDHYEMSDSKGNRYPSDGLINTMETYNQANLGLDLQLEDLEMKNGKYFYIDLDGYERELVPGYSRYQVYKQTKEDIKKEEEEGPDAPKNKTGLTYKSRYGSRKAMPKHVIYNEEVMINTQPSLERKARTNYLMHNAGPDPVIQ